VPHALTGTRWIHLFEEDAGGREVYGPQGDDVPLSRRPRRRLSFLADGSARVSTGGPDDRFVDAAASWREEGDEVIVRIDEGPRAGQELRVALQSPSRLLIRG
jgi:hypothetical protein